MRRSKRVRSLAKGVQPGMATPGYPPRAPGPVVALDAFAGHTLSNTAALEVGAALGVVIAPCPHAPCRASGAACPVFHPQPGKASTNSWKTTESWPLAPVMQIISQGMPVRSTKTMPFRASSSLSQRSAALGGKLHDWQRRLDPFVQRCPNCFVSLSSHAPSNAHRALGDHRLLFAALKTKHGFTDAIKRSHLAS